MPKNLTKVAAAPILNRTQATFIALRAKTRHRRTKSCTLEPSRSHALHAIGKATEDPHCCCSIKTRRHGILRINT